MEHKNPTELRQVAEILDNPPAMTRRERLERWAEVLERDPDQWLQALGEIEWQPKAERPLMRAHNSPLTVAFADPILREEGLAGDRLGDAMSFFELSEMEAHAALCSCMHGGTIQARAVARTLRNIAASKSRSAQSVLTATLAMLVIPPTLVLLAFSLARILS